VTWDREDDLRDAADEPVDAGEASQDEAEVAEIRADIEETRVEMGGTLRELGDRLEPGHLMNEAKENVREATIGRVEETAEGITTMVTETIRKNPIPAAMAAAGIALLWMNRTSAPSDSSERYPYDRYDERRSGNGQGIGQKAGRAASSVGDSVGGAVGQVGETVGQVGETVGTTVTQGVRQAGFNLERLMESSPLAMAAIAAGAGAVVGAILPETPQEREMLGDASRQLGEKVRDTVENVSTEAERTIDEIRQPAGSTSGFTSSSSLESSSGSSDF
jgi:Protein of unknown function (DUF3618)